MDVRTLRLARGLTLETLALRAPCDYSYLARIERGGSPLSPAMAERIARILEVSPQELVKAQVRFRRHRAGSVGGVR